MTAATRRRRGQPLTVLIVLLAGWAGMRLFLFDASALWIERPAMFDPAPLSAENTAGQNAGIDAGGRAFRVDARGGDGDALPPVPEPRLSPHWPTGMPLYEAPARAPHGRLWNDPGSEGDPMSSWRSGSTSRLPTGDAIAHNAMWLAAVSGMPLPGGLLRSPDAASRAVFSPSFPLRDNDLPARDRWSVDAWLLLRPGGSSRFAGGPSSATYGASQAGAVVRYRLAPDSRHRPNAYLRATGALQGPGEEEAALGLAARPFARVPIAAAAEARLSRSRAGTEVRPAAMVVSEIAPVALPLSLRADVYGAAGYVGGRNATAFVDGQARATREVLRFDLASLRAGAGLWGGAQKGASRLDVGPTASLRLGIGQSAAARLDFDYRFRVAGEARPQSGPAVTLSAGF